MTTVRNLIAEVERARADYLAKVKDLTAAQGEFKPTSEGWSIAEITEHLVYAEEGGIYLMWTAADGVRRGNPAWSGDPPHRGLSIEEIIEKTWRPKETVPPAAAPQGGGPLGYWITRLEHLRPVLERLGAELQGLDVETVIYPHPISGPLDARQHLEFLRFHLDRHRGQVTRVCETTDFPGS